MAQGGRADPHHRHGDRRDGRPSSAPTCSRLVEAGVAGLGFGLGFGHDRTPQGADHRRRRSTAFPLFEVPYPVPFIAITEAVFTRLARRAVRHAAAGGGCRARPDPRGARGRGRRGHRRVARRRRSRGGRCCSTCTGCRSPHSPARRRAPSASASGTSCGPRAPRAPAFCAHAGRSRAITSGSSRSARRAGSRRSSRSASPSSRQQLDRIVAGHALSLFAIELAKSRAVAEAERRLQGDFFDELARGELPADRGRAAGSTRFGFARDAQVLVVALEPVGEAPTRPARGWRPPTMLAARAAGSWSRRTPTGSTCCCRPAGDLDLAESRQGARPPRGRRAPRGRRGARGTGRRRPVGCARRATRCRCAAWRAGSTPGSSSSGPTGCCCRMAEPDALRAFADALLGAAGRVRHGAQRRAVGQPPGVPAAQRPMGDGGRGAVRAPPHAPVPDAQGRGAHRPRPLELVRPDGVLAGASRARPAGRRSPRPDERPFVQVVQRRDASGPSRRVVRCDRNARYWRLDRIRFGASVRPEEGNHGGQSPDVHRRRVGRTRPTARPATSSARPHGRGDGQRPGSHRRGRRTGPSRPRRRRSRRPGSTPRRRIASSPSSSSPTRSSPTPRSS